MLQKQMIRVGTWLAVVGFSVAVALAQDSAAGRGDSQIEMDVVHALDAAPQLKNDLITAATIQSEVTISGTVATAEDRKLAESIVAKVEGVAKVHNNLKVGDPNAAGDQQNVQPPPDDSMNNRNQTGRQDSGPVPPQQDYSYPTPPPDQNNQGQNGQYPPQGQGQYPPQNQQGQYPPQGQQGQYPPQGQYGQYPPSRPPYPQPPYGYGQQLPPQQAYHQAPGPLTVPAGALLALRTIEPVESKRAKVGEQLQFVVIADVNVAGYVAIPRGATVHGVVSEVKNPERGDLGGSPVVSLHLVSLDMGGQSYPLETDEFRAVGPNKGGHTASSGLTGALLGAVIGGMAGGGRGAAIGAGAGAGAGVIAGAASNGPGVWIPSEARVDFHLKSAITVTQVSQEEAGRLAQGLYPGGPSLYRRPGVYGGSVYYGYPYGYPPVYFHPYVMVGGYYRWR
jgi:hypothetical protein